MTQTALTNESTDDRQLPLGLTPADVLSVFGLVGIAASSVLPWLESDDYAFHVGGEWTTSVTGWEAPEVQLVLLSVAFAAALAVVIRVSYIRTLFTAGPLSVAAIVVIGLAGLYAVDPFLELTEGPVTDPAVSPGAGVYLALGSGIITLAAVAMYVIER